MSAESRQKLTLWWILWGAILVGLCVIYFAVAFRTPMPQPAANPFANLVGLVPLFVSIVIRWLVLPRYAEAPKAFVMFVIGLSLAEGCGIIGIFTAGPYRDDLFVLAVLGIVQFMPMYARKLYA